MKTQTQIRNEARDRALAKAHRAAVLLSKAQDLMVEAAQLTTGGIIGHEDYRHWAHQIGELLSCDNGEAGIGPAIQNLTRTGR